MMKRKTIFLLLSIVLSLVAYGQDFNNYVPLKSSGKIPNDLQKTSTEKYYEELNKLGKTSSSFEYKTKKKFLLQSRFYNDVILHSGRILFNDPMTLYINKVAAVILKDEPELLNSIRFYTLKSTVANAYCMDNGVILITTGLLAQLENEAQLAYIIGHELTHYEKKHAINQFLEATKMEKGKEVYGDFSFNEKIIASLYYSKEDEFEADKESVSKYIANSKYSLKAIESVFDVLQFSYLPFDDIAFDTTFFNTKYWKMPSNYWLAETKKVSTKEEDEDDKGSTHPNLKRRRLAMEEIMKKIPESGRSTFLVSESEFNNVQKIARYELSQLYLLDLNYASAIYNSYLLLRQNPNSLYLNRTIAYSLYAISKFKNAKNISKAVRSAGKIEGKSQALNHMLRKIKNEELNIVAINYIWKLYQQFPNDPLLGIISKEIIQELVFKHKFSIDDFSSTPQKREVVVEDTVETGNKKYDRIRKEKKKTKESTTYMLVELLDDSKMKLAFMESFDDFKRKKFNDNNELELTPEELKATKKEEKQIATHGYSLGIDTILAIDPFFAEYSSSKKESEMLIATESKKIKLVSQMKINASKAGLSLNVLDSKVINEDNIQLINDLGALRDWISETIQKEDLDLISCNYNEISEICSRYNTNHLYLNGMKLVKYYETDYFYSACYSMCIFPPYSLYFLYKAMKPCYVIQYYATLYNMENSKIVKERMETNDLKYQNDIVNSILYDEFNQIKRGKKSKSKNK